MNLRYRDERSKRALPKQLSSSETQRVQADLAGASAQVLTGDACVCFMCELLLRCIAGVAPNTMTWSRCTTQSTCLISGGRQKWG